MYPCSLHCLIAIKEQGGYTANLNTGLTLLLSDWTIYIIVISANPD